MSEEEGARTADHVTDSDGPSGAAGSRWSRGHVAPVAPHRVLELPTGEQGTNEVFFSV